MPEAIFRRPFHVEHIVAKQHGGLTLLENLAFACWTCNLKKGPNLTGIDPMSGEITPLYHPRMELWAEHFTAEHSRLTTSALETGGIQIRGLTPGGRTTVQLLAMNGEVRNKLRYELWREGLFVL
jgi:hypothetical protein